MEKAASLEGAKCGMGRGHVNVLEHQCIFHSGHEETAKVIFFVVILSDFVSVFRALLMEVWALYRLSMCSINGSLHALQTLAVFSGKS